jgi:thioredoxin reductase (NADPH)
VAKPPTGSVALTLYGRPYCHLCHDMASALAPIAAEFGALVDEVDVEGDPELDARYGEAIPVLTHGQTELCRHFLDVPRVRAYLAGIR